MRPPLLTRQLQQLLLQARAAAASGSTAAPTIQAAAIGGGGGWASTITTSSRRPFGSLARLQQHQQQQHLDRVALPASAAAPPAPATPDARRLYAKKAKGGGGGGGGGKSGGGAAVSASPDDPDAAPPPRVRPPFVAAARRRRLALASRPVPKATRDALAALAKLAPSSPLAAAAADDDTPASSSSSPRRRRPHLLRDLAWPLDPQDALVLLHDTTAGDVTGPGHTFVVPHVTRDMLQSAQACALFVRECLRDGVDFGRVEQFFVQTLAAQGQEQKEEEARRMARSAAAAAAAASRRAQAGVQVEEEKVEEEQEGRGGGAGEEKRQQAGAEAAAEGPPRSASSPPAAPPSTTPKTGITDLGPETNPFRPPRLLVKGMRVQIKGRLRGKGGEAEKRTWSWGATSASTFDDAVDYAQAQADTRAGAVGVKVWLVFREDAFDRERYALLRRRARDPETGRAIWRGPGWAADAVEELALAGRSRASRATGLQGSAVRRPATAWWSRL
jgi:hypothetical protein